MSAQEYFSNCENQTYMDSTSYFVCVCFLEQRSSSCDSAAVEGIQGEMRERRAPFHTWQQRRRSKDNNNNNVCHAASGSNSHPGKTGFRHEACLAILYTQKWILRVSTFWTALNLPRFSTKTAKMFSANVVRRSTSWCEWTGVVASAVILIRSHQQWAHVLPPA